MLYSSGNPSVSLILSAAGLFLSERVWIRVGIKAEAGGTLRRWLCESNQSRLEEGSWSSLHLGARRIIRMKNATSPGLLRTRAFHLESSHGQQPPAALTDLGPNVLDRA